jgi:flagellar biosynthetic protein FliR
MDFSALLFPYAMVFARLGGLVMNMPGLGEHGVSQRIRSYLVAAITMAIAPMIDLPDGMPETPLGFFCLLCPEIMIGFFMGFITKLLWAMVDYIGSIITQVMGLSAAMLFDPTMGGQKTILTSFLSIAMTQMFFVMDGPHYLFQGFIESYQVFPMGAGMILGDHANSISKLMNDSFVLAIRLSSPFLVAGTILQTSMGFLNRLMPQLQIFFLAMPVQVVMGLLLLMVAIGPLMQMSTKFFMDGVGIYGG